ncbi:MAG: hypothetical protein HYS41_02210 [Candidatus Omnitrophica bacterium]|nr:hypothetical protein [Candidatus Omnitrophota bacterium]
MIILTGFWPKVFLAAILTAAIAKAFRCPVSFPALFFFASIGWVALWILLLLAERRLEKWRSRK